MSNRCDQMKGIIPALITPYTETGELNRKVTGQLIRHLLDNGVSGFYLSGSTGEGFLQTIEERQLFLEMTFRG